MPSECCRGAPFTNEDDRPRLQFELETLVRGFFAPELFLDYLRHFMLFEQDGDGVGKKIAGYHQFHAVRETEARRVQISCTRPRLRMKFTQTSDSFPERGVVLSKTKTNQPLPQIALIKGTARYAGYAGLLQ